ncbi:MAG: ArsC/Spx/MgsR family protein, partial [Sphingomonas sp.]
GADHARLLKWIEAVGWEVLLNRAGTTFRKLPDADKADVDQDKAVALMLAHNSVIKRPVLEYPGGVLVGFKPDQWARALL